jgi:hypothetical protein
VLDRVTCDGLFAPPMIITNSEFRFVVTEQARARGAGTTMGFQRPNAIARDCSRSRPDREISDADLILTTAHNHDKRARGQAAPHLLYGRKVKCRRQRSGQQPVTTPISAGEEPAAETAVPIPR